MFNIIKVEYSEDGYDSKETNIKTFDSLERAKEHFEALYKSLDVVEMKTPLFFDKTFYHRQHIHRFGLFMSKEGDFYLLDKRIEPISLQWI